jgi:hypothetical protein
VKSISAELRNALENAPRVTKKVEAYFDAASYRTKALVTFTVNDESFTQEVDIACGPIIDLTGLYIEGVAIPADCITWRKTCLVPFCRKGCPILPEDAEVLRADGKSLCTCGKTLDEHPTFSYPSGMKHVVKSCDGMYYHL